MDADCAVASPTVSAPAPTSRAMRRKAAHDKYTVSTKTRRKKKRRKAPASLPPDMKPELVTTAQTRGLLGIRDTKLWQLIGDGMLETVKLDGRRMVVFESIEKFINTLRRQEIDRPRSTHADKAIACSALKRRGQRKSSSASSA